MGYRSEVAIALTKKEMERLFNEAERVSRAPDAKEVFGDATPEELLHFGELSDRDTEEGPWQILHFEEITWYSSFFKDVIFVMNFLDACDDENYHFIRIGNTVDDIEERGNPSVRLMEPYYEAHIEFDV